MGFIFAKSSPSEKRRLRARDIERLKDEIQMHKSEIELAQAELDKLIAEHDIDYYVYHDICWQDMAWSLYRRGIKYPEIVKRCNNAWFAEADDTPLTYDQVYSHIYKRLKKIEKYEKLNTKTDAAV